MKFFKQLVKFSMLLATFVSFAAQQNPCNDGFCDKPKQSCCKKRVTTDKLFVRENAKICGDLTVRGEIHNLELDLLRDAAVPPTDEVYSQFMLYPFAQIILENIQDFSVPRDLVVPGTEIYPGAPIYGYDAETQDLIPEGGPELSYNDTFEAVNLRYHGVNPADVTVTTKENVQSSYEHILSYYMQRGFPMPGIDVYPQYEGQFIFSPNLEPAGTVPSNAAFTGIKFYYEESQVPTAVDLVATAAPTLVALELFESDPSLKKNGFYYPVRVPITLDFNEFNTKYNKESIAYFDNLHRRLTIHVPECDTTPRELSRFELAIQCCKCDVDIDYQDNLIAFDGTFNLMRRDSQNQLVLSSFADLEYLIQASEVVTVKTEFTDHGTSEIYTQDYNFSEQGGVFTGLAIPLMNGASPNTDIYTFTDPFGNGYVITDDPLILPALQGNSGSYQAGDNPVTPLIEHFGEPGRTYYWDSVDDWFFTDLDLPINVMNGETTPEENPTVPMPTQIPTSRILNNVVGHEFQHVIQGLQGPIYNTVPGEAQATGIEMDPKANTGDFFIFRPRVWARYLSAVIRGDWPLTLPEINSLPGGTYGSSIFWRYLATQFDYNYQVTRRMNDILSHETFGPLLEENGIPFELAVKVSGTLGYNPAGGLLALAQAIEELHGKNIQDVFSDYAVSLAMLRNNASIPEQYRHAYPYWLSSCTYPGYQEIALFTPRHYNWWLDYQNNCVTPVCEETDCVMPPGYTYPQYVGQYFVPILDQDVIDKETQDMTLLIFEVPEDVNTVTVDVDEGEWRLSVVQFTSTGTVDTSGIFLMQPNDGPVHNNGGQTVFDVSQFPRNPDSGSVRLVAANVGIHDYEGLNNFCGAEPIMTGRLSIFPS